MKFLQGLSVLILGLGDSGLAMARWAQRCGAAHIRVADSREAPPQASKLKAEVPAAELCCGPFTPALIDGVRLVLRSPGLSPLEPAMAELLAAARGIGLPVWGELGLFARALTDLKEERGYAPKVIAITGTNGKTTTTSLTAQLAARCGLRVGLAGNIGPTLLDTLTEALVKEAAPRQAEEGEGGAAVEPDAAAEALENEAVSSTESTLPQVWVLELSSFQLDGVEGFDPTASTVLNVTQDHLDWHGSMQAYADAKACIFGPHTARVLNRDDTVVDAMRPVEPEPVVAVGRGKAAAPKVAAEPSARVVTFGLDRPRRVGDWGLIVENGMAWLVRAQGEDDPTIKPRRGAAAVETEIHLQRLMPADALRIRGRHNSANALAALALATEAGLPLAPMLHGLRDYGGEPHRVEYVGRLGDVEVYDDSKGTNVGATVAALNGLGGEKGPNRLVVILGGDGKGQDFAPLAGPVRTQARAVALIGRDADAIAQALQGAEQPIERFETLEAATRWCFEQARSGDGVLLSPACASLDMFRNYAHRAQVFLDTVAELRAERGEVSA